MECCIIKINRKYHKKLEVEIPLKLVLLISKENIF